eukprot:11778873-Karenia_brevis.AAC.1
MGIAPSDPSRVKDSSLGEKLIVVIFLTGANSSGVIALLFTAGFFLLDKVKPPVSGSFPVPLQERIFTAIPTTVF